MSDKPSRRGKTNIKNSDGHIVDLLTNTVGSHSNQEVSTSNMNMSNQGYSVNLIIDPNQSLKSIQGDQPNDLGIDSSVSNLENSGKTKSSGSGQTQEDSTIEVDPGSKVQDNVSKKLSNNQVSIISNKEGDEVQENLIAKDKIQPKDLVNANYLSILGDKPQSGNHGISITINSDEEDFNNNVDLTNKDSVFAKAMELSVKGNGLEAAKPSNKRATSANPVLSVENKKIPDGAVFENEELRYPIPLTIFDKDWQNKAMTCHVKKKSKSSDGDKSDSSYNGLPYADEWLLDYGEWSIYYNAFISAVSKFPKFTEWTIAHKVNVEK
ncbi:uncharacterized protein MELLADRAFT_114549 [Melampsora larici-populina 98AG31]|uniref:Uncharacterized protein n=1 Tax=Melampsora larici-populina (strain 98AG31 / pathotype 3-4-7) TaxID=747676 RepID=F4SDW8_MELLP|nr:uncharacterized protein MELLADRAFT_114549 [Melampsora larici-populina 98AG31]EGF97158.1 hypothetical protein MELLADRAFT_114549 [Melampsora larici-populina 98AG31]